MTRWHRHQDDEDAGFTLIELLVVIVVLPVIVGGIASALIVTLKNDSGTSNRISDSLNAQTASEYFVRDVQTAQYVTTAAGLTSATKFTPGSPQLCGSGTFLLGLYRQATTADPNGMDVGYWQNATHQVVRYSCSVSTASFAASSLGNPVVIADNVVATGLGNSASSPAPGGPGAGSTAQFVSIQPSIIAAVASQEWVPATPSVPVATSTTLCYSAASCGTTPYPVSLDLYSVLPFTMPGSVNVTTSSGTVLVTCTGTGTDGTTGLPDLTGCKTASGVVATAVIGRSAVTQLSISAIQFAVDLPGSSYTFSLLGTPRNNGSSLTPQGSGSPTLLLLGSQGFTKHGSSGGWSVQTGTAVADGGQIVCTGSGNVFSPNGFGAGQVNPTPPSNACNNVVYGIAPVQDPISPPDCFPPQSTPRATVGGVQQPGVYTNGLSGTIGPGVYEVTGGTVGTLTYSGPSSQGVLIYLAGNGSVCGDTTNYSPNIDFNGTWNLAPLSAAQSMSTFGSAALGDVYLWQDALNTQAITVHGASSSVTSQGVFYAPAAYITTDGGLTISTGRMIISGTTGNGGITATLNGS